MHIRPATPDDFTAIAALHTASIRHLCREHYGPELIRAWTGVLSPEIYAPALRDKVLLVAEVEPRTGDTALAGMGILDCDGARIDAVYIHPDHAGCGLGSRLLQALEERAGLAGVRELTVFSTLNAEPFYVGHGYAVEGKSAHPLPDGQRLACIRMRKRLRH